MKYLPCSDTEHANITNQNHSTTEQTRDDVQTSEHGLAEYSYRVKYMFQLLAKTSFSIPWGNFISSKKYQTHYSANIFGKSKAFGIWLTSWGRSWNAFDDSRYLEPAILSCILKFIDYSKSQRKKPICKNTTFPRSKFKTMEYSKTSKKKKNPPKNRWIENIQRTLL